MPVTKYTTFEQAREAQWVYTPDAKYYQQLREFYNLAFRLFPVRTEHRLWKFKTLQEANKQKREEPGFELTVRPRLY